MTPETVHCGRAERLTERRTLVLEDAYRKHPERFVRHPPTPPALPKAVYINRPLSETRKEKPQEPRSLRGNACGPVCARSEADGVAAK